MAESNKSSRKLKNAWLLLCRKTNDICKTNWNALNQKKFKGFNLKNSPSTIHQERLHGSDTELKWTKWDY